MQKKKKIDKILQDEPIGRLTKVADFLPPPEELAASEKMLKVTIAIDSETIDFFKTQADKFSTKYQRMMREVLKGYARQYHR